MKSLRIVFFGTPGFAVANLEALIQSKHEVVAVVTAPDKPAGRGLSVQFSEVKKCAIANNLPILQPEKLKNKSFLSKLKSYDADIFVVVAFRMLPELVWNMPRLGTINVHASLLPQYRGAAPINHAIINGEKITGVTTFKLQHEIDTGMIFKQSEVTIEEDDNVGSLHDKLMFAGADLLVQTLDDISEGKTVGQIQDDIDSSTLKHAPKIFKDFLEVNFNQSTEKVFDFIRGLSPYPTAMTFIGDKILKIFNSKKEIVPHTNIVGDILTDHKTFLKIACVDGFIYLTDVQLQGKKRMDIESFLRGYRLTVDKVTSKQ